ncbi:MAG: hypothetical protein JOZ41_18825, partial [Chloroflexi bacterium]|nr:hypothetical protein [Chloroflexota bacterium]
MIGREDLLSLLDDALRGSPADETEIVAEAVRQGVSRYAASSIHQTTVVDDVRVWVRAAVGQAVGQAAGNSLKREHLQDLVKGAAGAARRQEPNPRFVSLARPEPLRPVAGFDDATASASSEDRAAAIAAVVERVNERGWTVSGTYLTEGRELAIASSLGVSAYAPSSRAFLRALPDSGRGTGYAAAWSHRIADLEPITLAEAALERCSLNHDQIDVEPGDYEAVFDDLCVAEALLYLARHGFSGQAFEEGTSFLSGRLGEQVTGTNVTIWDDATDPRGLPVACDYEGVPKRKVSLIENGIAAAVTYDSFTAHRAGRRSTGHASDPERSLYGPVPANLFMAGGPSTLREMIR